MDDDTAELRNPFPSPPSHYTKYTSHNLALLALLKDRTDDPESANQYEVLNDQTDLPDWNLTQLEKPRVDWILEEPNAYYDVYGDRWFVKESIPSLEELGGHQLYPTDPTIGRFIQSEPSSQLNGCFPDRRPALRSVLRSLLVTYSALMGSLLLPPPVSPDVRPDWERHVEWINVLSQNLMAAANDLRPVQARGNLEAMMKRQLELRREETVKLHQKCDELDIKLRNLRALAKERLDVTAPTMKSRSMLSQSPSPTGFGDHTDSDKPTLQQSDVFSWASEV